LEPRYTELNVEVPTAEVVSRVEGEGGGEVKPVKPANALI